MIKVYFTFEPREDLRAGVIEEFPHVHFNFTYGLKEELLKEAKKCHKTEYGKYLKKVANEDFQAYRAVYESELFN